MVLPDDPFIVTITRHNCTVEVRLADAGDAPLVGDLVADLLKPLLLATEYPPECVEGAFK